MKNKLFRHLSGSILALFLALFCPMSVLAETVSEDNTVTAAGGAARTTADTTTWTVTENGVTFNVTYPTVISCGKSVTFQFEALSTEGNAISDVKYRIDSLYDAAQNGVSVYDVSYGDNSKYTDNTTWNFTFYASGKYYIRFSTFYKKSDGTYAYTDTGAFDKGIVLNINDSSYPSVEQIVAKVAAECQTKCNNDFDKAVWLNDWLVDNCSYDYSFTFCSAEGALARGTGTCEAYHRAYVMLLNQVGIAAGRITGNGHVWTAVNLDGKWYQVDTTWNDDPPSGNTNVDWRHIYFGLNDAIITLVHSDHQPVSGYESNSLDDNYFIRTGKIAEWANPQVQAVQQHINAGETNFSLEITDTATDINQAKVLYSLVAHVLTDKSWTANGKKVTLKAEYCPSNGSKGTISCQVQSSTDTGGSSSGSGSSGGGSSSGGGAVSGGSGSSGGGSSSGGAVGGGGGAAGSGGAAVVGGGSAVRGWTPSNVQNGRPGVTISRGVDYSSVYNYEYYITRYPDIKNAFGNNERAALNHFINYGIYEGRSARADFDVYYYRSTYPDLEAAFGDDLKSYLYHYLNHGIKEGRMGVPQR